MATVVNVYRCGGEWCYATTIDGEYDSSDTLGVAASATWSEAKQEAASQWAGADIRRVADVHVRLARTADAWWRWHDQDYARFSSTMEEAEARCAAWVAGESDDGPDTREQTQGGAS